MTLLLKLSSWSFVNFTVYACFHIGSKAICIRHASITLEANEYYNNNDSSLAFDHYDFVKRMRTWKVDQSTYKNDETNSCDYFLVMFFRLSSCWFCVRVLEFILPLLNSSYLYLKILHVMMSNPGNLAILCYKRI